MREQEEKAVNDACRREQSQRSNGEEGGPKLKAYFAEDIYVLELHVQGERMVRSSKKEGERRRSRILNSL